MTGFRLSLAPSTTWAGLARDLVASGAARSGLSVDRFADLLVLTEQVASDLLRHDDTVTVSLTAFHWGVEVNFETVGMEPSELTRLALERLADRHWQRVETQGATTGFAVSV